MQLTRVARCGVLQEALLETLRARDVITMGWNRVVDEMKRLRERSGSESRLQIGLEGMRHKQTVQILNALPDGIAATDVNGRITLFNQSLSAICGTNGESLLGKSIAESLSFESQPDRAATFLGDGAATRAIVVEVAKAGDTSAGVLRVARCPLRTADGDRIAGYVWCVRDITQQKLSDQMRNQFVYSATHELRVPLANIRAYAETLAHAQALDVEKQKLFCNTIHAEAHRLSRFIDDLLTISRMEVGAMTVERGETDMARLLDETIDKCRAQIEQKQITLHKELPAKLPMLQVDKDKLVVALVNLLGNAAKYTPERGTIAVHVEMRQEQMHIEVMDSGIGISVEELPKLFTKFFRSTDPRVQEQAGSGLGLSLSHEIVRLHGGRITVHSELGKGSKFTVAIPVR